ncbi:P-loop containing nucleoside triphosphate hydrolase protein, partial [Tribonema minus]
RRRSSIVETARVLSALVKQHVRTLAFCRTRKLTELVLKYCTEDLECSAPHLVEAVKGYRGGYTKGDRREIEGKLFSGKLLGVTATSALELGIDLGDLDVTIHLGYPGSVSSLWQQAGRAGRGGRNSLAILIMFDSPL